jgi:hypothetical protein
MPAEGSGVGEELDRKRWAEKYGTKPQEKKKPSREAPIHCFSGRYCRLSRLVERVFIRSTLKSPLASLSGIASYVDIRAKTDVYVGLLPAHALERLLEKRPIVLLTLAKRLISLLSPLGELHLSFLVLY